MYSLALIILVVSEKKAFEHFPIGSNVNLCPAMAAILDFRSAGHRLTLDPMGKYSNAFFSETTNMIKAKLYMNVHWMVLYKIYVFCSAMSCSGSHLGITINIKNTKFVKDLPMIDAQFRFKRWPPLLKIEISSNGQNCSILSQKVPKFELYKHNDELFNIYYGIFYEL
jgi:hypothetical protein